MDIIFGLFLIYVGVGIFIAIVSGPTEDFMEAIEDEPIHIKTWAVIQVILLWPAFFYYRLTDD